MNKIVTFLEKNLSVPMAKLSEQRHLQAVRDGVISALPFIIIGSFFLILAFPPIPKDWALAVWASENSATILIPYRLTMFIMSLYISIGIGYNLAKSYQLDPLSGAQVSMMALLLSLTPKLIEGEGFMLPMGNLGGTGLFVAILTAIFSVEVLRFCKTKNITIKMPEQVPASVSRSFEALIPVGIVLAIMSIITIIFEVQLHLLVNKAVTPLVSAGDSIFGVLVPIFLTGFFWSFGIHGASVVGTVARSLWEVYLAKNAEAVAAGASTIPHVAPETFYQWFVWIGGSGATLGLLLAMLVFAKSKYLKSLSRTSIVPGLFNINEPILFGIPIVLNPIMMIPFIFTPMITATLTYFATVSGMVSPTYILAPWTLPAPIGAFLATGGDWRAVVLVFINITISFFIYLPFFKMYDRQMVKMENNEDS